MNDDAQSQLDRADIEQTEPKQKKPRPSRGLVRLDGTTPEKPRGGCTGCAFDYQLGTARTGEHKGKLVIRKHNSRTGPGLCSGAGAPPRVSETDAVDEHTTGCTEEQRFGPSVCSGCDNAEGPASVAADAVEEGIDPGCCDDAGTPDPFSAPNMAPSAFLALAGPVVGNPGTVMAPASATPVHPVGIDSRDFPADAFTSPAPASVIPDGSVSMQPEPDRDRWGRYLIHKVPHTRATTFAKAASSTFTLNQWQQRMTIAGLVMRPDLVALAHGLDVKRDRSQLNSIAEQAKEAAGQKVAANLGTAYHAFSERLDAGLITLADVPEQYRPRLAQFQETVRGAGLTTRTEWIERSTAVRADQVSAALPVAGTLDRIYRLPNGQLVIGDLKTGADLSYAWGEIAVQLALYAHGLNTFGLFDWRSKTWEQPESFSVRTDFAIVVHLPAGGDGCTLHKVDLVKGWRRAQVCGQVMAMQADKGALSHPFTPEMVPAELDAPPPPVSGEVAEMNHAWEHAKGVFRTATDQAHLAQLYQFAMDSGKFHTDQLATLVGIGKDRLNELNKGA